MNENRSYTYEVRVFPVPVTTWPIARPGDFTLERPQPLQLMDTFEKGGITYQAAYVFEDGGKAFAFVKRSGGSQLGSRKVRGRPDSANLAANEDDALIRKLGAVHANLPTEQQQLFEQQLRRLLCLYLPVARL